MHDRTGEVYEWLENGEIFVIVSLDHVDDKSTLWKSLVLKESTTIVIDLPGTLCTYDEQWFSSPRYRDGMRRIA